MKKPFDYNKNSQDLYYKKKNKQSYDYNSQDGVIKSGQSKTKTGQYNRYDSRWVYQDEHSEKKPDVDNMGNMKMTTPSNKPSGFFKKDFNKKGKGFKFKKQGFVPKPKKKKRPEDDPYPQAKVNRVSLEMLEEFETNNLTLDVLCRTYFEKYQDSLKSKDRPQVFKTVFYVLRWRKRIDYLISQIIGEKEFEDFDLTLRNIYRLAAYDLMFMHRTLEHAILLAHFVLPDYYASYRDGMEEFIKNFQEKYKKVSYPDPVNDLITLMSVRYSHPEWIVKRWMDRFGEFDTRAILGYHNADKPNIVRVNRLKSGVERIKLFLEEAGYSVTKHPYMKYGLFVAGEKKLHTKDAFKNGEFFIMDDAQQIIVEWAAPKPEEIIIDACAGSGEKSLAISGIMGNKGKIIAVEFDPVMIDRFKEKMAMTECANIEIVSPKDIANFLSQSEHPLADKVIVDAPNSQLGNIIRRPESKWHLTEEQLKDFGKDQLTHLGFYAQFVKPGGELIFAVTSIEPEENEDVINEFMKTNDQFELITTHEPVYKDILSPKGYIYIEPHKHNLCGLFACKFRRKNG